MRIKDQYQVWFIDIDGILKMKSHHDNFDNALNWFQYLRERNFCSWIQHRDEMVYKDKKIKRKKRGEGA